MPWDDERNGEAFKIVFGRFRRYFGGKLNSDSSKLFVLKLISFSSFNSHGSTSYVDNHSYCLLSLLRLGYKSQ